MIISLIVAVADHRVIGGGNKLLWHLPADMRYFKEVTMGHPVIMGRRTFESIGRPLPGRRNIVITRDQNLKIAGCDVVTSLDDAFSLAEEDGSDEAFVIGGGQIYSQSLPLADRIYLTRVHASFDGDVFFPEFNEEGWELKSEEKHEADEEHEYPFTFLLYHRTT